MTYDLYKRRKELGLTLEQIGKYVGVSKSTVKKWESGEIESMRVDKVDLLAEILRVSPLEIIGLGKEIGKNEPKKTTQAEHFSARSKSTGYAFNEDNRKDGHRMIMYEKNGKAEWLTLPPEDYEYLVQTIEILKNKQKN